MKVKAVGKTENLESVKSIASLMILLVGFGILLLFKTYRENVISSFQPFMVLVVLGMGLLVSLLYLVNKK